MEQLDEITIAIGRKRVYNMRTNAKRGEISMKQGKRILAMVLAVLTLVMFLPATVANASGDYHGQVIDWINTYGAYNPQQGLQFISRELESTNYYYTYYFSNLSGNLMFESIVQPKSGNGTGIYLNMYLGGNTNSFYVDSRVYKYTNGTIVEELPIACNDNRSYFTQSTYYQLEGNGGSQISLATAENWFNNGLQDLMKECDKYLYQNLGFGMKCLGFVKYQGLGPDPEGIPAGTPGDMNDDGIISNDDVVALMWHNLFPSQYPMSVNADLNHDGTVNNDDVIALMWHNLFPNDYPLR